MYTIISPSVVINDFIDLSRTFFFVCHPRIEVNIDGDIPKQLSEIKLLSTKLAHASNEESLSCRFCITKQFAFSTKTREMHRKLHLSGEIRAERKRDIDRWRIYRNENISRQKVSDELRIFNSADEIKKCETWTNSLWVGKAKTELKIKKKNFPNAAKFLFYNSKAIFFSEKRCSLNVESCVTCLISFQRVKHKKFWSQWVWVD